MLPHKPFLLIYLIAFIKFVLLTNKYSCDIIHSMAVTKRSEGYPITEMRRLVQAVRGCFQRAIASELKMRNNSSVFRECSVSAKELSDSKGAEAQASAI